MTNLVPRSGIDDCLASLATEAVRDARTTISIVTPVLDRRDWVGKAVESVRGQWFDGLEHIVVDGGSTDGTLDLLRRYPHLRLIEAPGSTSNEAIDLGIEAATGEVVGVLSSDDVYGAGTLRAVAAFFDGACAETKVGSARAFIFDADTSAASEIVHVYERDQVILELLFGTPGFNSWFFVRDVFALVGLFDPALDAASDRDFMLRLVAAGLFPERIPDAAYVYTRHSGSRSLQTGNPLAEEILADHLEIARRARALTGLTGLQRDILRAWHAWERYQLVRRRIVSGRLMSGIALAFGGILYDPIWPSRIAAARRIRRALADRVTQLASDFATNGGPSAIARQ